MTNIQTINRPVAFSGTEDERKANRATHNFCNFEIGEAAECSDCCARTYHVAADYPCGVEPEREVVIDNFSGIGSMILEGLLADFNDAEREDH